MSMLHGSRVRSASVSLEASSHALLAFLDALPHDVTTGQLVGGWTPAARVWHVALTNDLIGAILTGDAPIQPVSGMSDFTDAQWNFTVPPPVASPDILVPPFDVKRAAAAERLRESVARLRPVVESLEPARATLTAQLPWARLAVYQLAEWAGGHTLRHLSQIGRELHMSGLRVPAIV